jgi:NitT/TauT family transport system substrate-binding protein
VVQSYTINLFLVGGVDAACAMWYNEYDLLRNAGIDEDELTVFRFSEHGLNFPEDGIYCLENTWKKDPRTAQSFVAASFEGWLYAFEHPQEAVEVVLKYMRQAHIPANRVHQEWMLARIQELMGSDMERGMVREDDFARVVNELTVNGMMKKPVVYGDMVVPKSDITNEK